ncbi:MAG: hypothetical protein HC804_07315 [Anaerolineae bacterium]|nr:hypothetical protein [Anaerolineae bacterium]
MVDCVAIVSGGMDSVTLLHYLVKRQQLSPAVITFIYGQKHAKEVVLAQAQAKIIRLRTTFGVGFVIVTAVICPFRSGG